MKWLRGLFGKKRKGLPAVPDSPDNWHIGDMAECIGTGRWFHNGEREAMHFNGPTQGETRIVTGVSLCKVGSGEEVQFLSFSRWPMSEFAACMFRKLTPHADETGVADADFVRKMKRGKIRV